MMLDHEGLEVYQVALDFLVVANAIIEGLPRGRGHLSDQFTRASLSMVLNIAEGAGKYSKPDKRRYYLTARGSEQHCFDKISIVFPRASRSALSLEYRSNLLPLPLVQLPSNHAGLPMEHTSLAMDSPFPRPLGHGHGHGHVHGAVSEFRDTP